MGRPLGYIGTLAITWQDGQKNEFQISFSQNKLWIDEHPVRAGNDKDFHGLLGEFAEVFSHPRQKVEKYNWLELVKPMQYPKR